MRAVRRVMPTAGCHVPAAVLGDSVTAAWVRAQGVAVVACGDDDLDRVQAVAVRPVHVILRCGTETETIRRAVGRGVVRFIASTPYQVEMLSRCALRTKFVYLDEKAPAVFGEHRLQIVGLHGDVDLSVGVLEWGAAAERLLCRAALMKTCGMPLSRISLTGGSAAAWRSGDAAALAAVASVVDEALDEGCARWRLPRPTVTLSPLTE